MEASPAYVLRNLRIVPVRHMGLDMSGGGYWGGLRRSGGAALGCSRLTGRNDCSWPEGAVGQRLSCAQELGQTTGTRPCYSGSAASGAGAMISESFGPVLTVGFIQRMTPCRLFSAVPARDSVSVYV